MRIKPALDTMHVVFVGNFNSKIFQPSWFALHGMLGAKEADAAENLLVHQEVTQFRVDQFELQVLPERFALTSRGPHPEHIRDLALSCFGQFVPHTPIRQMGINRAVHFDTGDFEVRDRVGTRLAPKEPWGAWGAEILKGAKKPESRKRGGMMSLTMREAKDGEPHEGHIQAKVEPSKKIENNTGIYVEINDHFDLVPAEEGVEDALAAVAALEDNWERSRSRAGAIIDEIMRLTEECA